MAKQNYLRYDRSFLSALLGWTLTVFCRGFVATDAMKVFEIQNQFGIENLTVNSRPDPKPGFGEVLIKVKACSLNYRDFLMIIGKYNPRQKLPLIPLSDGAGEVVEIGAGVTKIKVGDRVCGIFSQGWQAGEPELENLKESLGGPLDGLISEYRIFPETGVIPFPDHLSYAEASTLPCAGLTAYNAVVTFGGLEPGKTVVVLGTGGVSLFALQFAKMLGCKVIVTSSSDEKLERAKILGADDTINYNSKANWDREIRKKTAMKGADLVIEIGGAGTLQKSINSTRPGGTIALIGVVAGGGEATVSLFPVLMQGIRIQGVIVGSKSDFARMNQAISFHRSKPIVDKIFPFSEFPKALEYLRDGKHFGKVVIEM
ncbi:alcohol dehydrogenase, catalytic domain, GroES-like family [Leptospira fainei serovar Hurstbridge str. BUT 6]|uniref:Alcohol dehydrogenase, catalytic domain, GroES-like family n=2 Tax=Leptospira fainei TaxID=48782 RepID=S3UYK3_9LEPT|nr:alcohol dehydrogenase, catalytic domain, GroES-like family [Leptospira fainei serovar Hurstbridge str. BUT 6]